MSEKKEVKNCPSPQVIAQDVFMLYLADVIMDRKNFMDFKFNKMAGDAAASVMYRAFIEKRLMCFFKKLMGGVGCDSTQEAQISKIVSDFVGFMVAYRIEKAVLGGDYVYDNFKRIAIFVALNNMGSCFSLDSKALWKCLTCPGE